MYHLQLQRRKSAKQETNVQQDGGDTLLRKVGSQRYIPEDGSIQNYRCKNLKSYYQDV
jgi:hypothetical protein